MTAPPKSVQPRTTQLPGGAASARQPCYPILATLDLGQWLCAPRFRVVCLFRTFVRGFSILKTACTLAATYVPNHQLKELALEKQIRLRYQLIRNVKKEGWLAVQVRIVRPDTGPEKVFVLQYCSQKAIIAFSAKAPQGKIY